jgi:hypothetical protein
MTDFMLGWLVVLLAMICLQLDGIAPQQRSSKREYVRGLVGVLVTSFLCALIVSGAVSLLWKYVLS